MPLQNSSASPPAPIRGPNTFQKFGGTVEAAKRVTLQIGTSDVTSHPEEFWEVHLKVEFCKTYLADTNREAEAPAEKPPLTFVYVPISEVIRPGDRLEGQTRTALEISQGWTSGRILKSYVIHHRPGD